ncbi:hypothetical protein FSP39_008211 [Pinctada imbricata]|uniref:Uncharacterized protein n=1 Tax=Pinctada imbricata TaxID=66713 RepID=A0AA88YMM9_PINIB|nr:hypothetical protein FSP39_008211 [Pinctada imbricata]
MTREDLKQYSPWNLEATAKILARRFPDSVVMVIKPAAMFLNMFSIFSNFLPFSNDGIPEIGGETESVGHLVRLYRNCLETDRQARISNKVENACTDSIEDIFSKPISLVGFSKGCVVLNQLMFDLDPNTQDEDQRKFIKNLKAVYWLDSGHVGDKNAWITDHEVLKKLKDLNLSLYVHVTPYQIRDSIRKWIGEEEEIFVQKLKDLGANITEKKHFFREKGSIENHFKILKEF